MPFSCCKYAVFEGEGETLSLIHFLSRCLFAPPLVEREIRLKHNCPEQFGFPCGVDKQGYKTSHISLPTFLMPSSFSYQNRALTSAIYYHTPIRILTVRFFGSSTFFFRRRSSLSWGVTKMRRLQFYLRRLKTSSSSFIDCCLFS